MNAACSCSRLQLQLLEVEEHSGLRSGSLAQAWCTFAGILYQPLRYWLQWCTSCVHSKVQRSLMPSCVGCRYGHDQLVTTASGTGLQTNTHHGSYTAAGSAAATAMDPGYYYSWVDAEQQMASLSQLQTGALPVSSGSPLAAARKPGRTTPGGCTRKKATKKTPKRPAAGG